MTLFGIQHWQKLVGIMENCLQYWQLVGNRRWDGIGWNMLHTNVGSQLETDVGPTLVAMHDADVGNRCWTSIPPTLGESQLQTCNLVKIRILNKKYIYQYKKETQKN